MAKSVDLWTLNLHKSMYFIPKYLYMCTAKHFENIDKLTIKNLKVYPLTFLTAILSMFSKGFKMHIYKF